MSAHATLEGFVREAPAMVELGSGRVHRGDRDYPESLEHLFDPPPVLHWKGNGRLLGLRPAVAIVGARAASEPGREIARTLARDLAVSGCLVISGLARGIDAAAHEGALEGGGATLAVLGTGIDVCYPPEHARLSERIRSRGLLVCEFPAGTEPRRHHFPRRNRILAALADVLVVVEGGEKSGARSTVDHALDLGRDVMAVPRDILHGGSVLPNRLIVDGARPVLGAADVLAAIPLEARRDFEPLRHRLLELMQSGPQTQGGLVEACGAAEPRRVLELLVQLELEGAVRRADGKYERLA